MPKVSVARSSRAWSESQWGVTFVRAREQPNVVRNERAFRRYRAEAPLTRGVSIDAECVGGLRRDPEGATRSSIAYFS